MNICNLEKILAENNQPKFRLEQIKKAVFQEGISSFSEISTLSKELRNLLERELKILSFIPEKVLSAQDGLSVKAVLKLEDGNFIETVLMSAREGNWSVCVSSQVGCPLGCAFCATGEGGFKRNLTSEEMTDQVLFWKQYLKKLQISKSKFQTLPTCLPDRQAGRRVNPKLKIKNSKLRNYDVSNIVYMGMGEPFLNFENVKVSILSLIDPKLFGFGARSISVSTSGVSAGIEKMAEGLPQINLAVSLHFADNILRSKYMPINRKFDLEVLRQALKKYFLKSRRKVMLEYIMLSGINDSLEDAKKLAVYLRSIEKLQLLHVNLIKYNSTSGKFSGSRPETMRKFKDCLLQSGINTTIRKSLGSDIQGACGQLAGKN